MCRLFGFRSIIPSQVHRSLLAAENALGVQSNQHPDGWGVAFYVDGSPHITRNPTTALGDSLFHRLSGVVSSETVLAHVRKATQGNNSVLNCHPFQYGRWTFAHNGDVPNFSEHHQTLRNLIAPGLRRFVLGDTDSEVLFFILLSNMAQHGPLSRGLMLEEIVEALRQTVSSVRSICDQPGKPCLLTFMLTDGVTFLAARGGKELFWSTYKRRCSERNACPSLSDECEAPSKTGFVNHFIVSSEPLQGENVWEELDDGDVVGVDHRMRVLFTNLERRKLQVLNTA
ncbi:MAG TPA: class II glutamine amidotransferase [Polyangiaceae bacterium]|nr:class II glutamine amidotransferase [Polyangiaceae bacterium]